MLKESDWRAKMEAIELGMAYLWGKPAEAAREQPTDAWPQMPTDTPPPSTEQLVQIAKGALK